MLSARDATSFAAGFDRPDALQERLLLDRIVGPNAGSAYGRRHGFAGIRSVEDFQRAVPIVTYADLAPDIRRVAEGEPGVLTVEPVRRFFATSGSTGGAKTVPVTSSLVADKARAFGVYWDAVFRRHPAAAAGRVVGNFADSAGGGTVPCGLPLTSEGAYWNAVGAAAQRRGRSPVPKAVTAIADPDDRYYTVARILLEEDVSLLMALNPSTLLVLLRTVAEAAGRLVDDVARGGLDPAIRVDPDVRRHIAERYTGNPARAARLRALLSRPGAGASATALWPGLALVISWRSPMQAPYLRLLDPLLGAVPQRDYLLMASEGVIAIPVDDTLSGGVLATPFHFFEFIDEADLDRPAPPVRLAGELEEGRAYAVLLSTTGGLYRYHIGDVVRVRGFAGRTPVVEFLHRCGATSSLTGEKLTEDQVVQAMDAATIRCGLALEGYTLCPGAAGFPHYVLLAEPAGSPPPDGLAALLRAFEEELGARNIEYRAKRHSRRLGPPELWAAAPGAYDAWRRRRIAGGANDAQIKPVRLTRDAAFSAAFDVRRVVAL